MGKILVDTKGNGEHEEFIQGLQAMYNGTKKWGTVRVTMKRSKSIATTNIRTHSHFLSCTLHSVRRSAQIQKIDVEGAQSQPSRASEASRAKGQRVRPRRQSPKPKTKDNNDRLREECAEIPEGHLHYAKSNNFQRTTGGPEEVKKEGCRACR